MIKKIFFIATIFTTLIFAQTKVPPKYELKDINGKTTVIIGKKNGITIPDSKGKIILVEFWGTHCPPCIYSIPHYIELTKKYKDKLAMYAIEVQGTSKEQLKEFVKEKGINYNIYTQSENMNFVRYLAQRAGWRGAIPFLVIFDQHGNVVDMKIGMVSKEYIEKVIEILEKRETQVSKDSNSTQKDTKKGEQNITKDAKTIKVDKNTTSK